MNQRPIQYFTKEYLQKCKSLTPIQIIQFLDDFQRLMAFNLKINRPTNSQRTNLASHKDKEFL